MSNSLHRRFSLTVIPLLFVAGLIFYKTRASLPVLRGAWARGAIAGRSEVVSFGAHASTINLFQRSLNYFVVIGPALLFGILISTAVRAYVSPDLWRGIFAVGGTRRQFRAGLAGTPLMLCSCCVAPIFGAVYEGSGQLAPSLTLMLASPALNPAALALTFILFGPAIGAMRLVLALAAVAAVGPTVEALFPRMTPLVASRIDQGMWRQSFGRALYTVVVRTVPALVVGLLFSMLLVQWLPAGAFASGTPRILAIVLVASLAVPLALPTFLEIPLALSLLAAGLPAGAALALLFAGPVINLPSLFATARMAGAKVAISVAVFVWLIAIAGGLLI
jgi:uncharacterized membrane protein YraQ (UPF0718 family)